MGLRLHRERREGTGPMNARQPIGHSRVLRGATASLESDVSCGGGSRHAGKIYGRSVLTYRKSHQTVRALLLLVGALLPDGLLFVPLAL